MIFVMQWNGSKLHSEQKKKKKSVQIKTTQSFQTYTVSIIIIIFKYQRYFLFGILCIIILIYSESFIQSSVSVNVSHFPSISFTVLH